MERARIDIEGKAAGGGACVVDVPYLLALNAGVMQAPDGGYYADRSWAKDLLRHTTYLPQLTFLAPVRKGTPPADWPRLPEDAIRIVGYPNRGGRLQTYLAMPLVVLKLLREVPRARIVHTCVAGYPFPLGWIAVPLARLFGRKIVLTVESSFWRIPVGQKANWLQRRRAGFWEAMNRYCLRQADYASYPHEAYRASLPSPRAGGGVLFQASWIEADQIASAQDVAAMWAARAVPGRRPTFLFATRMVPEKGTRILAEAIRLIEATGVEIGFDMIGVGPELEGFRPLTRTAWGRDHVRILDPIPYGPQFFAFLRDYDAVLSPGLSDEQPRIVYDAYAGGVPSIASDMPGLAACVKDGVTGRLVPPGDPRALADAILAAAADPAMLAAWGAGAREAATRFTHDQMHLERCRDLQRLI